MIHFQNQYQLFSSSKLERKNNIWIITCLDVYSNRLSIFFSHICHFRLLWIVDTQICSVFSLAKTNRILFVFNPGRSILKKNRYSRR